MFSLIFGILACIIGVCISIYGVKWNEMYARLFAKVKFVDKMGTIAEWEWEGLEYSADIDKTFDTTNPDRIPIVINRSNPTIPYPDQGDTIGSNAAIFFIAGCLLLATYIITLVASIAPIDKSLNDMLISAIGITNGIRMNGGVKSESQNDMVDGFKKLMSEIVPENLSREQMELRSLLKIALSRLDDRTLLF